MSAWLQPTAKKILEIFILLNYYALYVKSLSSTDLGGSDTNR